MLFGPPDQDFPQPSWRGDSQPLAMATPAHPSGWDNCLHLPHPTPPPPATSCCVQASWYSGPLLLLIPLFELPDPLFREVTSMFLEYSSGLKRSPTPARRSCPVKMKASVNPSGMSAVSCCLSSLCRNGLKFQESAAAVQGPRGSLICLCQRPCRLMEMAKDLA